MSVLHEMSRWSHHRLCLILLWTVFTVLMLVSPVSAAPYAETGDVALRHDLEYLADRGLITIPITTWPLSWADISAAVVSVNRPSITNPYTLSVLNRLESRVARNSLWGVLDLSYGLGVSEKRTRLRTFTDQIRGTIELEGRLEYTGQSFVANIEVGLVDDGLDSDSFRLDGSYAGFIIGNVAVVAGSQDVWWGPGHAGSLILSNNARPVPGINLRRNVASRFRSPYLRWIGPWSAHGFAGRLESDRAVSQPYLLGLRVTAKPLKSLELGVSRAAQWGGEGRPETLRSLVNLAIGRDNVGEGVSRDEEPGNQLAGFDARWSLNGLNLPVTLYSQLIGEDEAGGFPSRYLGQGGVSTSFPVAWRESTLRLNLEYSDTTCQFNEDSKLYNCAYNNSLYPTGYRFRGRALGHSTDNDSSQMALLATLNSINRQSWQAVLRSGRLNRGGSPDQSNSLTPTRVDYVDFDLHHTRPFFGGKAEIGFGISETEDVSANRTDTDVRFYLRWHSMLR